MFGSGGKKPTYDRQRMSGDKPTGMMAAKPSSGGVAGGNITGPAKAAVAASGDAAGDAMFGRARSR